MNSECDLFQKIQTVSRESALSVSQCLAAEKVGCSFVQDKLVVTHVTRKDKIAYTCWPSPLIKFRFLTDLPYYLRSCANFQPDSLRSVFCGLPQKPQTVKEGHFTCQFKILHHNGTFYHSSRQWSGQPVAGDFILTTTGELCEVESFVLNVSPQGIQKLCSVFVLKTFQVNSVLTTKKDLQAAKQLPVTTIASQAVLYPLTNNSFKVVKLQS